jgi:hypothetical protein
MNGNYSTLPEEASATGRPVRDNSDPAMNTEFAALAALASLAARVPRGTICLNSGLSYWDLSDELPATIHLAVPRGAHWPKIDTPATTLHRFAAETFELDRIEQATGAGEPFWIYSAERCVVDAMRLQHVVGRDVALSALVRYARSGGADPLRLTGLARRLGGARRLRGALEAMLDRVAYQQVLPAPWTEMLTEVRAFIDPLFGSQPEPLGSWDPATQTWASPRE